MNQLAHATNGNPVMHAHVVTALLPGYVGDDAWLHAQAQRLRDAVRAAPPPPTAAEVLSIIDTVSVADATFRANYREEAERLIRPHATGYFFSFSSLVNGGVFLLQSM